MERIIRKVTLYTLSAAFAAVTGAIFVAACGADAAAWGAAMCVVTFTVSGAALFATLAYEA